MRKLRFSLSHLAHKWKSQNLIPQKGPYQLIHPKCGIFTLLSHMQSVTIYLALTIYQDYCCYCKRGYYYNQSRCSYTEGENSVHFRGPHGILELRLPAPTLRNVQ